MTLRFEPVQQAVVLTLPRYTSVRRGMSFVNEKKDWLQHVVRSQSAPIHIDDGVKLLFLGEECIVKHLTLERGVPRLEDGVFSIPGMPEFLRRRTKDAFMNHIRSAFLDIAAHYAEQSGKTVRRITLKDTHSRWGSCSVDGKLTLSWRLAFAPRDVMEYVICHEVAHLSHMDHSKQFWSVVAHLCPDYKLAKDWLKANGQELYRYQF